MKEKIEKIVISAAALLVVVSVFLLGLLVLGLAWQLSPPDGAYTVLNPKNHSAAHVIEEHSRSIYVNREFVVSREIDVSITRSLVKHASDGAVIRIDLPSSNVHYFPGTYKIQRIFDVPTGVVSGTFKLHSRVCWTQNPVKSNCVDLPVLDLVIKP
jgi:hypothetical protein